MREKKIMFDYRKKNNDFKTIKEQNIIIINKV